MLKPLSMLFFSLFILAQNICPLVATVPLYPVGEDVDLLSDCEQIVRRNILNITTRDRAMVRINNSPHAAKILYRNDYPWIHDKYRHCVVEVRNTQYPAYQLKTAKGIVICDIVTTPYVKKLFKNLEQREFYNESGQSVRPQIEFRAYEKTHEIILHYNESEYVFLQGSERSCFYLIHEIYKIRSPKCCGFRINLFFDEKSLPLIAVFSRNMLFDQNICSPIVEFKSYAGVTKYFCGFLILFRAWYEKSSFQVRSSHQGAKCMFAYKTFFGLRDRWDVRTVSEPPRSEVSESSTFGV